MCSLWLVGVKHESVPFFSKWKVFIWDSDFKFLLKRPVAVILTTGWSWLGAPLLNRSWSWSPFYPSPSLPNIFLPRHITYSCYLTQQALTLWIGSCSYYNWSSTLAHVSQTLSWCGKGPPRTKGRQCGITSICVHIHVQVCNIDHPTRIYRMYVIL